MNGQGYLDRRKFVAGTAAVAAKLMVGPALHAASPAAQSYRIGIYTRPWDQFDYRYAFDAAAEAGYKYVGLMTTKLPDRRLVIDASVDPETAEKVGQEAKQRGLEIPSVYGGGLPVQKSRQEALAALCRLIDNCVAAGARTLLLGGIARKEYFETYYAVVAEGCDYAAEKKLPITLKPHGGLNADAEQCKRCVELVNRPNFSIWYDPGNILYYSDGKLDPVKEAEKLAGLVREGVCIKDFTMSQQGQRITKSVLVTPGDGMVDFPAVLKTLRKGGFASGDLVVECVGRTDPTNLRAIQKEAVRAKEYLEKVLAML